jgi:hypothetical protein
MKAIYLLIVLFSILIVFSGCGKKSETDTPKKDSTSAKTDSIKNTQSAGSEKDEPGFYGSNIPMEEYLQKHPNLNKKVEFQDLVDILLINKYPDNDKRDRLQSWSLLADKTTSPINWLTKGSNGKRTGEVIMKFNGKTSEYLDKYVMPVIWTITMKGNKDGADMINIDCNELSKNLGLIDIQSLLNKKNIKANLLNFSGDPSTGKKEFKLVSNEKEPMWMVYSWSCGSGGCTADFNFYYNENTYKTEITKGK